MSGTEILAEDGSRPIEFITEGMLLWSWDTTSNAAVLRRVKAVVRGQATQLHTIKVGKVTIGGVTDEHPFYNPEQKEWVKATDLQKGDVVLLWSDGQNPQPVTIDEKQTITLSEPVDVYNLTVEGPEHNYFAQGILVHNKSIVIATPPQVIITSHVDGDILLAHYEVSFRGTVSDQRYDYTELIVTWTVNNTEVCLDSMVDEFALVQCDYALTEPGEANISFFATNPTGLMAEDTITVSVFENSPPVGEILSPSTDGIYYSDTPIVFSAMLSDDIFMADELVAEWESDLDGVFLYSYPDADGYTEDFASLSAGEHTITLRVSGVDSLVTEETISIMVNQPD